MSSQNIFKHTKSDLLAGLVVFLVALPLCLGIALASEAPLLAGIISGVIGGIVVGFFSKSHLSVSGPAAGLILIVLGAVETLGSYQAFLLAVFLAGILQLFMGFIKAGIVGLYFPSSVIKGMLAAIGLTLILKQIPHLVGFDADAFGEMEFFQKDGSNTISYLMSTFDHVYLGSVIIGFISLGILVLWQRPAIQSIAWMKQIPGGLVAVLVGVGVNQLFIAFSPDLAISGEHLVNLPDFGGDSKEPVFQLPDFSTFSNPQVYLTAATLALVASLETLLSVEAVDKLDPHKRRTPQNAELKAQGIGNMLSGLIGGLPITAVIVRSSANVEAGGRSKMSAIYHGIILLGAVALIPGLLNKIPFASLAAILIIVGIKLTKPALYKHQFILGWNQFIPFIVTVVAIFITDLLIGILIGMAVGAFFILRANYKVPYVYHEKDEDEDEGQVIHINLSEHVSFLNKARLLFSLDQIAEGSTVVIDGSSCKQIDHDALEVIHNFKDIAEEKQIALTIKSIPGWENPI